MCEEIQPIRFSVREQRVRSIGKKADAIAMTRTPFGPPQRGELTLHLLASSSLRRWSLCEIGGASPRISLLSPSLNLTARSRLGGDRRTLPDPHSHAIVCENLAVQTPDAPTCWRALAADSGIQIDKVAGRSAGFLFHPRYSWV